MMIPRAALAFSSAVLIALFLVVTRPAAAQEPTAGYNTPWRNADGSTKLALSFGGGIDTTLGPARRYQERGWNYTMGGGYNFNRRYGVMLEYAFHHAQTPPGILQATFDGDYPPYNRGGLSGNVHLWSITAEPVIHYFSTEHYGGYVVGGGGFYRKLTSIQSNYDTFACRQFFPGTILSCLPAPGSRFSNNAGGLNIGTGLAWRISDNSNVKAFVEARYIWVDNQPSPANTVYLPANYRVGVIPLTGGLRW